MLKVYGYMSVGLAITGVVAWLFASAYDSGNGNQLVVSLMQPPMAYLIMFAPLGIILWMSFGINKMSASTSQNLFWVLSACYGISLSSIFLVYTLPSIARVFFYSSIYVFCYEHMGLYHKKILGKNGIF